MSGSARPALTAAVVAALRADPTLQAALGGPRVWVDVPQGTEPPYLWVLAGDEGPVLRSPADRARRQVQLEVQAVSAYRGTSEVDALLSRVIEILDAWPALEVPGYTPSWSFVTNRKPVQAETVEGGIIVWLGTVVFNVRLL